MTPPLNKKRRDLLYFTITAFAVLLLDKFIVFLALKEKFFGVEIYKNPKLPAEISSLFYFLLFSITLFLIFAWYSKKKNETETDSLSLIALGLMAGGVTSNFINQVFFGYIADYLPFLNIFYFNLADAGIYSGAFILGWKILKK